MKKKRYRLIWQDDTYVITECIPEGISGRLIYYYIDGTGWFYRRPGGVDRETTKMFTYD